jgi:hypothetical protein
LSLDLPLEVQIQCLPLMEAIAERVDTPLEVRSLDYFDKLYKFTTVGS